MGRIAIQPLQRMPGSTGRASMLVPSKVAHLSETIIFFEGNIKLL